MGAKGRPAGDPASRRRRAVVAHLTEQEEQLVRAAAADDGMSVSTWLRRRTLPLVAGDSRPLLLELPPAAADWISREAAARGMTPSQLVLTGGTATMPADLREAALSTP